MLTYVVITLSVLAAASFTRTGPQVLQSADRLEVAGSERHCEAQGTKGSGVSTLAGKRYAELYLFL